MPTIRFEVGIDSVKPEELAPFWAAALGYTVGDMDRAGTYLDLVPPEPAMPGVYLQRVPEAKTVKNRLHLDLVTTEPEEMIARLLGARGHQDRDAHDRERRWLVAGHGGPRGKRVLRLQLRLDLAAPGDDFG